MALTLPTASEITFLKFALGHTIPGNQILKLYVNDVTPGDADVAATYTEMSTQGYVAIPLTKTSWTVTTVANVASGAYAQQTFPFDGTGGATTVYGYYVIDTTSSLLLWAERFGTPKVIEFDGDQILITPTITLSKV